MKIRTIVSVAGAAMSFAAVALATEPATHTATNDSTVVLDRARVQAPNGQWFEVTKQIVNGEKQKVYRAGDLVMNQQEYTAWQNANPPSKIDPALAAMINTSQPQQLIPVAIWLAESPYESLKNAAESRRKAEFESLDARREALAAQEFAPNFESAAARQSWLAAMGVVGDANQDPLAAARRQIAIDHETLTAAIRDEVSKALQPLIAPSQQRLIAQVEALGGQVRATTHIINGASVFIPAGAVQQLANDPAIANLVLNQPGEPELDLQATSLGLTTGFWANSIDGGIWDGGQLDSGIQQNHPTFGINGAVAALDFINGPGRGTTDSDGHGTAVASIIAGRNATNRGMAFGLETLLNMSWDDPQASVDWAFNTAVQDPEGVNGSFGIPADAPSVADYTSTEIYLDFMMRTQNFVYTKSAGNLGSGANTLTQPAGIFNGLVVANMNDTNDTNRANDVINASSSRGPTLGNRKKPDIAAPGTPTTAANNDWAGAGADWISFGGTSSAAPHVCGGVLLLTDARSNDTAITNKAILINTADAWTDGGTLASTTDDGPVNGSVWNATYGWGYLDLGAAYTNRFNIISSTLAETPDFKLYRGTMPANSKATLVWNRFVTSISFLGTTLYLPQDLTDMDLVLYRQDTGTVIDSSTAIVDNVEQVFSASSVASVLKVDLFGDIDDDIGATDAFALAHPGSFVSATGPDFAVVRFPAIVSPGEPVLLRLTVTNTGDLPAHNVNVSITSVPAGWSLTSTGPVNIGTVDDSTSTVASIGTLTPPCNLAGTTGTFDYSVTSSSYGEFWSATGSFTITVAPITAIADGASVTFSAPRTYSFVTDTVDFHAVGAFAYPASNNINVQGDNDPCITSPWHNSNFADRTDFVIVNGTTVGASTQYAHISDGTDITPQCVAKHDDGFDVGIGGTGYSFSLDADEPIEVIEASMNLGSLYRIEARINSGLTDIAIMGYNPDATLEERNSADFSRDGAGAGATERLNRRATQNGVHGFVVANDNKLASNITFIVKCAADYNGAGGVTIQDVFDFLTDWFAGNSAADFNLSGGVPTIQDIFDFLTEWFAGNC